MEKLEGNIQQSSVRTRGVSFPYVDLNACIELARAVHNRTGNLACPVDQIAAEMDHTDNGTFRGKLYATRLFGLIENAGKKAYKLTDLGKKAVDEDQERDTKIDAFLHVRIYEEIYTSYRGSKLPNARAIEKFFEDKGVSPKQCKRARRVFDKSSEQAGFKESGSDRLVEPKRDNIRVKSEDAETQEEVSGATDNSPKADDNLPHLMVGLIEQLPNKGEKWSLKDREIWLQAANLVFSLLYEPKESGGIQITLNKEHQPREEENINKQSKKEETDDDIPF